MTTGDVETFLRDGQWYNRVVGEVVVTGPFLDLAEAALAGRNEAQRWGREHFVHNDISDRRP